MTRLSCGLLSLALLAVPASVAQAKGPFGGLAAGGEFEVFSSDDEGGGRVIHEIRVQGDLLWRCGDVVIGDRCNPVPLPDFMPATALSFIHIDKDSIAAWLKGSVPGAGDSLMACRQPGGHSRTEPRGAERVDPQHEETAAYRAYGRVLRRSGRRAPAARRRGVLCPPGCQDPEREPAAEG